MKNKVINILLILFLFCTNLLCLVNINSLINNIKDKKYIISKSNLEINSLQNDNKNLTNNIINNLYVSNLFFEDNFELFDISGNLINPGKLLNNRPILVYKLSIDNPKINEIEYLNDFFEQNNANLPIIIIIHKRYSTELFNNVRRLKIVPPVYFTENFQENLKTKNLSYFFMLNSMTPNYLFIPTPGHENILKEYFELIKSEFIFN